MIVKNENHVIQRCLSSLKPLIDTWVIVDTGSTDGTQETIRAFLSDIPGELHERPWVNFSHNRNEAMALASGKADYLLFIDADDQLVVDKTFQLPRLQEDLYYISQKEASASTHRENKIIFMVKNDHSFQWKGVLHEYLSCERNVISKELKGLHLEYIKDGARSKNPNQPLDDIEVLKKALEEDPNNSRHVLYIARSYWSIRDYQSALPYFEKRATMGGDPIEVYYCLLYTGLAQKHLNYPPDTFIQSFCKAYLYRPSRTESIYELARYYVHSNHFLLGYLLTKLIIDTPKPKDNLFVETWVYDWGTLLYLVVCCIHLRKTDEAKKHLKKLLNNPRVPKEIYKDFPLEEWKNALLKKAR